MTAESYFAEDFVLMGVDDPAQYAPNPDGLPTGIALVPFPAPTADDPAQVSVRFVNAVTDAPTVDVRVQGGAILAQQLSYGSSSSEPISLAPGPYTFEVVRSSDQAVLGSFSETLNGTTAALILGGFLDPAANQDGPPMDLIVASDVVLPVELVDFEPVVEGRDVVLTWETASEVNNSGFAVEVRQEEIASVWKDVAFVDGAGTSTQARRYTHRIADLEVGTYRFRLRQVDADGTFTYSPVVEASVGLQQGPVVSPVFPDPFNTRAQFSVAVPAEQHVRVTVYDVLGRAVARLHDGPLAPGRLHTFTLEQPPGPSGLYFIRVHGEHFQTSRAVTVVR